MPDTTDIEIVQSDTSSTQQDLADNCSTSSSTQHDSDSTDDPKEILSKKREENGFYKNVLQYVLEEVKMKLKYGSQNETEVRYIHSRV